MSAEEMSAEEEANLKVLYTQDYENIAKDVC